MTTKTCSVCSNNLPLSEYHKHLNGYLGVKDQCRHCVCDQARARKIKELESKAAVLVDHLEKHGPPHIMGLNCFSEDERYKLWEVTSEIQWLKSLPRGLPPEGTPKKRPRHVQNPWSTGMGFEHSTMPV